ncbi:nucleotide pyrophosphohydrolase [Pseudomonas sp. PDM07]|uniref:nucleotide pyrophosphohydrolase n=1 Tax=Pseudomonas sp. PDM07 TaxID=2769264 RepID=UPI00177D8B6E|nr:nucleotide pyrophosphohydrolase [Pseudomonas sp. PDM07]MBD9619470.1 nucleotide pyrophosphohydrolase [Pseudomonas sp. PDM07]
MSSSITPTDQLAALRLEIDRFSEVRDWRQFHTPKNLSMAMSVEASELMEIFQWQVGNEDFASLSESKKEAVAHEVADVFIYLMRFCSVTGIDPLKAAQEKLKLNDAKYPAVVVKGKSDKYSDY